MNSDLNELCRRVLADDSVQESFASAVAARRAFLANGNGHAVNGAAANGESHEENGFSDEDAMPGNNKKRKHATSNGTSHGEIMSPDNRLAFIAGKCMQQLGIIGIPRGKILAMIRDAADHEAIGPGK